MIACEGFSSLIAENPFLWQGLFFPKIPGGLPIILKGFFVIYFLNNRILR